MNIVFDEAKADANPDAALYALKSVCKSGCNNCAVATESPSGQLTAQCRLQRPSSHL